MSKHVVALEDDPGYEQLLRNLFEGRGWQFVIGNEMADISGSLAWAEVAVIDLDAAGAREALAQTRTARPDLPVVVLTTDETAIAEALDVGAVVTSLPGTLVESINRVCSPPENLIDLSERRESTPDRPWYVTS